MTDGPITIAETSAFIAQAKAVFSEEERQEVVNRIAADPKCGVLIPGSGGVRKVRMALPGKGKSGGARVVYFYHNDGIPLYLLAAFAKNEKANLTRAEIGALKIVTGAIVRAWEKRKEKKP